MNTCIDCLPCLARNAIDLAKKTHVDAARQLEIAAAAVRGLATSDFKLSPPEKARGIMDLTLEMSDRVTPDPYLAEKDKSTVLARELVKRLDSVPGWNPDDFESRLRLSVAGNILDFSVYGDLDLTAALETVSTAFTKPVDTAAVAELKRRMDAAKKILFILDNCGEAVFDRVFIEPYRAKTTVMMKGRPAFNDVTRRELADSGFTDGFAGFVDNGTGVPGVVLDQLPADARAAFESADLIVAKGQGNFETMNEFKGFPIVFLFLAKCPVVIRMIGAEPKSIQVRFL